jgi:hypothetical protein
VTADRAEYILGLHALADALKLNPELPLPYEGRIAGITLQFLHDGTAAGAAAKKQEMLEAAARFPVQWTAREVRVGGDGSPAYTEANATLHGLKITLVRFADPRTAGGTS